MLSAGQICPNCKKPALYPLEPECRACYQPPSLRSPNVLLASSLTESLQLRVKELLKTVRSQSSRRSLEQLRDLANGSKAVATVPPSFAERFLSDAAVLYASYHQQVEAGIRAAADFLDDRRRALVDALLYGTYGRHITFAALSVDGEGLSAWGDVHMQLDPQTIQHRATVIEENSFQLVNATAVGAAMQKSDEALSGRIATWATRGDLIAAKLGRNVLSSDPGETLALNLLKQGTSRETAQFCEVHIYGSFNYQAVRSVIIQRKSSRNPINQLYVDRIKSLLRQRRIGFDAR